MTIESLGMDLVTASQSAGVSVSHFRAEIAKGRIKAKKNGNKVVILRSELERYLEALPDWTPGQAPAAANEARRSAR